MCARCPLQFFPAWGPVTELGSALTAATEAASARTLWFELILAMSLSPRRFTLVTKQFEGRESVPNLLGLL